MAIDGLAMKKAYYELMFRYVQHSCSVPGAGVDDVEAESKSVSACGSAAGAGTDPSSSGISKGALINTVAYMVPSVCS